MAYAELEDGGAFRKRMQKKRYVNEDGSLNYYERRIFWSKADKSFLVEVPALSGCMADGQTPTEAIQNSDQIIREWIEAAKKDGRKIPKPQQR